MQIRVIKPVQIIIKPRIRIPFLAGETVGVRRRQIPALRQRVPKRVIQVFGRHRLAGVDQHGDVSIAIRVVIAVGHVKRRGRQRILAACQQPADAARTLKTAAQILPPRVFHHRLVVGVPLLHHQIAVVNEMDFVRLRPGAARPGEIPLNPPPQLPVIHEIIAPHVGRPDADQLVLIVIGEAPRAVGQQVAVQVVRIGAVCDVYRHHARVRAAQPLGVGGHGREGIQAVGHHKPALREGIIRKKRPRLTVDRHRGRRGGGRA